MYSEVTASWTRPLVTANVMYIHVRLA